MDVIHGDDVACSSMAKEPLLEFKINKCPDGVLACLSPD